MALVAGPGAVARREHMRPGAGKWPGRARAPRGDNRAPHRSGEFLLLFPFLHVTRNATRKHARFVVVRTCLEVHAAMRVETPRSSRALGLLAQHGFVLQDGHVRTKNAPKGENTEASSVDIPSITLREQVVQYLQTPERVQVSRRLTYVVVSHRRLYSRVLITTTQGSQGLPGSISKSKASGGNHSKRVESLLERSPASVITSFTFTPIPTHSPRSHTPDGNQILRLSLPAPYPCLYS